MTQSPKQLACWKHNSFFGHTKMTMINMKTIYTSTTTTTEAKNLAIEIEDLCNQLMFALSKRKDQ